MSNSLSVNSYVYVAQRLSVPTTAITYANRQNGVSMHALRQNLDIIVTKNVTERRTFSQDLISCSPFSQA